MVELTLYSVIEVVFLEHVSVWDLMGSSVAAKESSTFRMALIQTTKSVSSRA